jgi:xanthine dehydrogenase small subunit
MRASAEYRMLAARNLLMRVYLESVSGKAPVSVARDVAA